MVFAAALIAAVALPAQAGDIMIDMYAVSAGGVGSKIGTIRAVDSAKGLLLVPHLAGLKPGDHGFHLHQNPSCSATAPDGKNGAALGAGGHLDPQRTGHHEGPEGKGHLGDLPYLIVGDNGEAANAIIAPHLKVEDLWGHALVIHAGGDNYTDNPPLGGGGARIACGVIAKAKKKM
jgi:superoxide dismutase, Cu-Zn family